MVYPGLQLLFLYVLPLSALYQLFDLSIIVVVLAFGVHERDCVVSNSLQV